MKITGMHKECSVQVRINDWVGRKREISRSYLEMFRTAKSQITLMSPYFLPGYEFRRSLKGARRRGVTVRVIQTGVSDIAVSKYAERFVYRWLFKNKVEVYEYQKTVLHGKIGLCDNRWMTVGSYNLNNLSAYMSIELNLDVDNVAFVKNVDQSLTALIETDCKRITEETYERTTSWSERLVQRLAYNLLRLIFFLFTFYWKQKE